MTKFGNPYIKKIRIEIPSKYAIYAGKSTKEVLELFKKQELTPAEIIEHINVLKDIYIKCIYF